MLSNRLVNPDGTAISAAVKNRMEKKKIYDGIDRSYFNPDNLIKP